MQASSPKVHCLAQAVALGYNADRYFAPMLELADRYASEAYAFTGVRVQVPLGAHFRSRIYMGHESRQPIIIGPSEGIVVRPVNQIIGPPIFLQQELGIQSKNTCFPTSIFNASIALQVIDPQSASVLYKHIMQDLVSIPACWNGENLRITDNGAYLIRLFEHILPIRVGYQYGDQKFITGIHSYDQIHDELQFPTRHVIVNHRIRHAFATIDSSPDSIVYIDGMSPLNYQQAFRNTFGDIFGADEQGYVTTTPIQTRL